MAFEDDGYLLCPGAVGPAMVMAVQEHLASLPGVEDPLVHAPIDGFLRSAGSMLGILAADLLRSPVELLGATYVVRAGTAPSQWHQDGGLWVERLGERAAVTAWLALDSTTPTSGCLRVVPGSHACGSLPVVDPPHPLGVAPAGAVHERAAVDLVLVPGDVSFHHPALLRSSGPNTTGSTRRALVLPFAAAA